MKPVYQIFIIIPVYNEKPVVLAAVIKKLQELPYTIVLIDDGSTDKIAKNFIDECVVLTHPVNLGQGAALQTGFQFAKIMKADAVVTFDADGQHIPDDLDDLLTPVLSNQADVALGSRFLKKKKNIPAGKMLVLHIARWINFLFTGILLTDAHNGLRAFNKTAIEKIRITENRMAHASEILFEIKKHRLRFIEVPVNIIYTDYAKQKGQSAWDSIKVLFDLVLHKLFK